MQEMGDKIKLKTDAAQRVFTRSVRCCHLLVGYGIIYFIELIEFFFVFRLRFQYSGIHSLMSYLECATLCGLICKPQLKFSNTCV